MGVREGGSYVVDPGTGEEKLVERTEQPDPNLIEDPAPPPAEAEVPTAPARRRGPSDSSPQE